MSKITYTVAIGNSWNPWEQCPEPDYMCGHKHMTLVTAQRCGKKLYQLNIIGYHYYIVDNSTGKKVHQW